MPPIHPGEILNEEFLKPLRISQYRLAKAINVPPRRITRLCTALDQSALIPRFGWRVILGHLRDFGLTFKRVTTSRSKKTGSGPASSKKLPY